MGTRSAIVMQTKTGFKGIYCHWDGYPAGVGATLKACYKDPKKVKALIALGDISSLGEEVAPAKGVAHSFNSPAHGVTVAYGRDRGESGTEPKTGRIITEVLKQIDHMYAYLFDGKKWVQYK